MATHYGIIRDSDGHLLRAGFSALVAGAGETQRTDAPFPAQVEHDSEYANLDWWDGDSWEQKAQPTPIIQPQRIPAGTTTQRDAIPNLIAGMLFCNTTTGQMDFYDGSVWAAVGGGGGGMWTSIQKQTITSGVSQVDFESGLTGKDAYKLVGSNVELDANADFRLRVKAAGAYKAGSTDYEFSHHVIATGGPTSQQDATSAFIELTFSAARADADKRIDFEILFGDLSQVSFHNFMYRCAYMSSATNLQVTHGGGRYIYSDDIEGIRIYPSTGNIDKGVLELFGR